MAGSQTWRVYEDDRGNLYSVPVSKHVATAFAQSLELGTNSYLTGSLYDPRSGNFPPLPSKVQMRYAVCHPFHPGQGRVGKSRLIYFGAREVSRILLQYIPSIRMTDPKSGAVIDWVPTRVVGESWPCVPRPDEYA